MTLLDYMNDHVGEEIAVHDVDYDMEAYFYGGEPEDDWDRAMQKLASLLEVKEIETESFSSVYVKGVTVNLSQLIEENLENIKDWFIVQNVDAIMDSMPSIISGNVSEKWLTDFVSDLESSISEHEKETEKEIEL